jgi:hypothetical protein
MLYDPKWDVPAETKTYTLANFIAWLEKQPCGGKYDYAEPSTCAVAQWLKQEGHPNYSQLNGWDIDDLLGKRANCIVNNINMTYGAALDRAKRYLKHSASR